MMFKRMNNASPLFTCAALAVVLTACASQYEAPIDDRSDTLRRESAIIVNSGESVDTSLRRESATIAQSNRSSTSATGSTVSSGRTGAGISAGVNQPGEPVGDSATIVRAVNLGGGISRNTTRSSPSPASLEDNAASSGPGASITRQPLPSTPAPQTTIEQPAAVSSTTSLSSSVSVNQSVNEPVSAQAPQLAASNNVSSAATQHRVARGDTLYSIAWRHNMDVRSLALINGLSEPYTIYPGQVLQIQDSGVSSERLETVPDIPVSPAGEEIASGQRPQAAIDGRRVGSVNERDVEGVTWQWPSDGRLLSMFNTNGSARGIDIAGSQGDAVFASADGDVVYAGAGIQGAGNLVILRHSARHLSAYMHNSRMLVSEGDFVRGGDKIAEVGTGPDGRDLLHFEVRLDGKPVNPVRYLPNR